MATGIVTGGSKEYELFEDKGKQGLKDQAGKVIIPAQYEALGWSKGEIKVVKGVIGFKKNDLWGLLNVDNEEVITPAYTQLYTTDQNFFVAALPNPSYSRDFLGLLSPKGDILIPFKYAYIEVSHLRAIVAKKAKDHFNYGLLDLEGDEVIPLAYKQITALGSLRFAVKNFDNKMAIFDDSGHTLLGFELDSISAFVGDYAIIYDSYSRGLIAKNGEVILPPTYQDVTIEGEDVNSRTYNQWVLLGATNNQLAEHFAEHLERFSPEYFLANSNDHYWLIDESGQQITPDHYQRIEALEGELAMFKTHNKWGLMNKHGKTKIPAQYDSLVIDGDMIMAKNKAYWSLYDTFNVKKTATRYEAIGKRSGRLFPVRKNDHWGFVNRSGDEVIHCVYDQVGQFVGDYVWVSFHKESGIINKKGEWVVLPTSADSMQILNDNYYISYVNGLKKLYQFNGNIIYFTENAIEINDGYLLEYLSDGGIWKIDFSGRIVGEARDESYEEVRAPSEGLYAIKKDGRYGFIDTENRLRIANRYEGVGDFHEGLAAFKLLGKWGFLNKKEEIVIQPSFTHVSPFYGKVAIAFEENGAGLIDKMGHKVSSFHFDSVSVQDNGRFLAYKDGKVGLLDDEGKLMVNAKYDYILDLDNPYSIVGKSGKYGLVDSDGVNTIPMIYDELIYDVERNAYLALKKSRYEKVRLQ